MQPQLVAIVNGFNGARDTLHVLVASVPADRWTMRSDQARWSVAECIEHLNLTSRAYIPLLRAAFATHPAVSASPGRYRRDPVGWLLGTLIGPLPRIGRIRIGRVRTQPAFEPTGTLSRDQVVADFERLQDEQIELTRVAEGLPLETIRIVSPFGPRISYNAYSCLCLLPRHQHRHLQQAAEVWGDEVLRGRQPMR